VFTARDVQENSGLTSRQLNDWDERGALPHDRETGSSWRRFSMLDVFILMTCAELKRQFGVSVDRVKYVQECMLQEGANHLEAAIRLMSTLGVGVWLLTDLEKTFIMDSELEFADLWQHGYFGGEGPKSYAMLKMNPIVNQLLACRSEPVFRFLPNHGRGYELMSEVRSTFGVRSPEELEVLQLIRSGEYESVEIIAPDGRIETILANAKINPTADLYEILRKHPFQSLTVKQKDGRMVSIQQEAIVKHSTKRHQ
jgi:DNA-binding transcriptional MerR regulator